MISEHVCTPSFSYRTHAYVVTPELARSMASGPYRDRLIPVDEYLPTLYCEHPREDIAAQFGTRRHVVFAAQPNIVLQREDLAGVDERSEIETSLPYPE